MKAGYLILVFSLVFQSINAMNQADHRRRIQRAIHAASMTAIWITLVQTALLASFAIGLKIHEECAAERECPDMITSFCVFPTFAIYGMAVWQYFKMEEALSMAFEYDEIG